MNKKLRIAAIAVSVVMASSMAFGIFGCGGGNNGGNNQGGTENPGGGTENPGGGTENPGGGTENPGGGTENPGGGEIAGRDDINYDDNHRLTVTEGTLINMNVGNGTKATSCQSIAYRSIELTGTVKMPDGKEYNQGDLKPAWAALATQLKVNLSDQYTYLDSNKQLTTPKDNNELHKYDIITASSAAITENTDVLVNINDYLDYMPNYKAFLEANPVTRWSLTSDPATGAMYYAPYYDGNDDIEKYVMTEHSWVEKILDATTYDETVTFAQQATAKSIDGTSAKAESYMGKTGSWIVATSKPGDTSAVPAVGYVKVDYDAVISALSNANSPLAQALTAAGVTTIDKTSGNIVDIQNQAINATSGAVTGAQLIKITQEYIKVAYSYSDTEKGTYTQLYGATVGGVDTKLSDVFNSTYAAWDVDLMTAMYRCTVTNPTLLGGSADNLTNLYGLAARQGLTNRRNDLTAFCGELFGIRGMESRYEWMYVGADGNIKDARTNAESFDLIAKMGALVKEGLVYAGEDKIDGTARDITKNISMLMMHDYSNTQSKANWTTSTKLAPISTPVSKWDTDENGTHETVMRFTESWRSVKNSGFCLTKAGAGSSKEKLTACLALIDYMFSNDGQILMTYGQMSSNNTNPDGWWIGTEGLDVAANPDKVELISEACTYAPAQYKVKANADGSKDYFVYNGKLYKGQEYAGGYVPKMTDASYSFYNGEAVNGVIMGQGLLAAKGIQNYTNYARMIIGTTLPIGNKNQGFEYQATQSFALTGTGNVGKNLNNGTIKHVKLTVDEGESLWYMICPTTFALDKATQDFLKTDAQTDLSGKYFYNSSSSTYKTNMFIDVFYFGFDTTKLICGTPGMENIPASGAECVSLLAGKGMNNRVAGINRAWQKTKDAFKIG